MYARASVSLALTLIVSFASLSLAQAGGADSQDAVVAADGSGDFTTIQAAIYGARYRPTGPPWIIHVKPGVYEERVYVQRERGNLRLVGDDPKTTILTGKLHAHMPGPDGTEIGTFRTPTLQIDGGGFEIENLTIENAAGPVGQALALRADGDKLIFRNCRFLGWQDTLFLNRGRLYFEDCRIEGNVDFIFGGATVWFENCHLHFRKGGYLTAASTPSKQRYGFVFHRCRITGEPGVRAYLGRPWRPYSMTAFLHTNMSEAVRPEGWNNWGNAENEKTTRYIEFNSSGDGANVDSRVKWAKQLTKAEAEEYTVTNVLGGEDGWNPH